LSFWIVVLRQKEKKDRFDERFADLDDPDLSAILQAYDLTIPKKQYSYGEMVRMKKIDVYGGSEG